MIYILATFCIVYPVMALWAYRQGIRDGKAISKGEDIKPVVRMGSKPPQPTETEKKAMARLAEIEAYKG